MANQADTFTSMQGELAKLKERMAKAQETLQYYESRGSKFKDDPENKAEYDAAAKSVDNLKKAIAQGEQNLQQTGMPTGYEAVGTAMYSPDQLVKNNPYAQAPEFQDAAGTTIPGSAQMGQTKVGVDQVGNTATAEMPKDFNTSTYESFNVRGDVKNYLDNSPDGATGKVTDSVKAQTMNPKDSAAVKGTEAPQADYNKVKDVNLDKTKGMDVTAQTRDYTPEAEAAQITGGAPTYTAPQLKNTPQATAQTGYNLGPLRYAQQGYDRVLNAAQADETPQATAETTDYKSTVTGAKGEVSSKELVDADKILKDEQAVQAVAETMTGLNEEARMVAAQGSFTQAMLAKAAQGQVSAKSTVQGQMSQLMAQFNDGTPEWAAGAIRNANAAMAARGLGGSSMAGAAIVQAAMESAIPIASADAATFAAMEMQNLSNQQQVALKNAEAVQGIELKNLDNRQQAALQNSTNAFNLQYQSLSNLQATVLANAQLKAAFQGKTIDLSASIGLANAAKYSEKYNINLSNEQQALLQKSNENLQVEMSNLSNAQSTALANLQVMASLTGQELSNEQQMAVLQSTQNFERAASNASMKQQAYVQDAINRAAMEGKVLDNKQQTALFNVSAQLDERKINLSAEQQALIDNQNANLQVDLANLNSRVQTSLANAQIDAALAGQELSNKQQAAVINAATVLDLAKTNFTADQEKALRDADIVNSVNLANLSADQAKMLADHAALAQLDVTNLNNRQQAEVENARNFLQMDLANLSNEQQTMMFKQQSRIQAMFSDQAAENVERQFNATSENQKKQFWADLSATINRTNTEQINSMRAFNVGEKNAAAIIEAQLKAARDQFMVTQENQIASRNAEWRQNMQTLEFAAQNDANLQMLGATNGLTASAINALWQNEADLMEFAWQSAENAQQRLMNLALGDKELEGIRQRLEFEENAGKGSVVASLVGGLANSFFSGLGGDGGFFDNLFGG